MNSLVIYGSHFGNTQKVAYAIAAELRTLGLVKLLAADEAPDRIPEGLDLLVVGGPTEGFRMTAPVANWLARLEPRSLHGLAAAVFDTRIRPRWWLLGYAGPGIGKKLTALGAHMVAPPEGFFVEGKIDQARDQFPVLEAGEIERAARWAAAVAQQVEATSQIAIRA